MQYLFFVAQQGVAQYDVNGNYRISGNVGVGMDTSLSRLHIWQSSNVRWAAHLENLGGTGKGLLIKSGHSDHNDNPALQVEKLEQ